MSEDKKQAFWLARIQACEASGLGKMAYCREHNINPSTFYYWQKIFQKKTIPSLIPVRTIPIERSTPPEKIDVKLPSGVMLHLPLSLGFEKITQLILSLEVRA
jgi:hypothetical protein